MNNDVNRTLIIGAKGTIGSALVRYLSEAPQKTELYTLSRENCDYTEESFKQNAARLKQAGKFSSIIICIGSLHNQVASPEKRLSQLSAEVLHEYFQINTILPSLCVKHFAGLLDKTKPSQMVALSAMVGSITDNQLGGWYGYRSSKAALNMIFKTASIEISRSNKMACLATIHPGTTQGPLSKPFSSGVSKDKYYTADQSAERIWNLTQGLHAQQTGSFFNWDGSVLPW
ncbi:MAG: NAD(P)-dependent dehydrogenase (short-subunit alcohol dehydrogenase family) [Arenicella sp.]|jgi:NAD(P)-dependent dehydrogenase (short-subunit alcohol dehydrogenase family)